MPGWTDPFDPDRTSAGPADQRSEPPDEAPRRVGRHRAPEPDGESAPRKFGAERYRPVLGDPPTEFDDGARRWLSRPVVLAGIAVAAVLTIAVGIAGLLMPPGTDRATTASAAGGTAATPEPGMAGGAGVPSTPPAAAASARPPARPTPSARTTRAPTRPTTAVAAPRRTASPTPRPTASTATATPARTATASPAPTLAQQVVNLVNQERDAAGCRPLTVDSKLTTAAQLHSEDQAAHQTMSHTGSDGSTLEQRIDRVGYDWSTIGENVAYGQSTPAEVMDDWMNSDGHRSNILNCDFDDIGVGVARDADGRLVWTQDFGA